MTPAPLHSVNHEAIIIPQTFIEHPLWTATVPLVEETAANMAA